MHIGEINRDVRDIYTYADMLMEPTALYVAPGSGAKQWEWVEGHNPVFKHLKTEDYEKARRVFRARGFVTIKN